MFTKSLIAQGTIVNVAIFTNYKDGILIQLHHNLDNKLGQQQIEWSKTNGRVQIIEEFGIHVHASFPKN